MALKHTKVSVVVDDPAADIKPSDWNADHVVDGDGLLITSDTTIPTSPASGFVNVFGRTFAGRACLTTIDNSGQPTILQPTFGKNKIAMWASVGNTASSPITTYGMLGPTASGTATARSVATTNLFTATRRVGYVSAATAASTARAAGGLQFFRGDASGKGGFYAVFRWGCSDAATVTGARSFIGFCANSAGNVEPSSLGNIIGVGTDAADSTFYIMHNDASGTATKVSLGANFPDHTLSADLYELGLYSLPNTSQVFWQVTRLNTGDVASGTITTDLPTQTQLLIPQFMRNNNATALAVGVDVIQLYIETDN